MLSIALFVAVLTTTVTQAIKDISIDWEMRDLVSGAVREPISDDLTVGSILHGRAEFNDNKPAEIKLLTESDIPGFFITVEVDGSTVNYGNDRTQFTKTLTDQLSTGEIYEYYIKVTSDGYTTTFNGEQLELTLFTKTNWQCMDKDTDYPGQDISFGPSSGIDDCYKKCKDRADCISFMIYDESAFSQSSRFTENKCWLKSKKYGEGAVTLAGLQAGNMDCFIDNWDVTKLQGGGALFNKVEMSLVKVEYVFKQTTANIESYDAGSNAGYFYTVVGSLGETAEHDCVADRSVGVTSSCSITDSVNVGNVLVVRIRNNGTNAWRLDKIVVKVDGEWCWIYKGGPVFIDDYETKIFALVKQPSVMVGNNNSESCSPNRRITAQH